MENEKQPAFASPGTYNPNNGNHNGDQQLGLTKREYFAGLAMQGMLSNSNFTNSTNDLIAIWSIQIADSLLEQLNKQ
jgi:hypothetical protein